MPGQRSDGYALLPSDDRAETAQSEGNERKRRAPGGGLRFEQSKDPWVVSPYTQVIQVWNAFVSALFCVDLVYLPAASAFSSAVPPLALTVVEVVSTVLLSLDMLLQFFLEVRMPGGDVWIVKHRKIIRSYLTGYFLPDLVSVLPLKEAFFAVNPWKGFSYVGQLMRCLRLSRGLRVRNLLANYVKYLERLSYVHRTACYSIVTVFLSVHWMGCVWTTLGYNQHGPTWLDDLEMDKPGSHGRGFMGVMSTYFTSTYFALYTLTGIGYGDIVPTTASEYWFTVAMMLCGSLVWATIIGEIVNVIQHSKVDEFTHQEKMDVLLDMSKDYNIDNMLLLRLQDYFKQLRIVQRASLLQHTLSRMNAEIAVAVVDAVHSTWMDNVWWLAKVKRTPFLVQLVLEFCPLLFCPKEQIVTGDRLYVVQRGLCVHGRQVLSKDMVWGTDMLLLQPHLRSDRVTLAISYVHVNYLTRDALVFTLERFPQEQEALRRAYRTLVVIRGVVWKAKQIKAQEAARAARRSLEGELDSGGPSGRSSRSSGGRHRLSGRTSGRHATFSPQVMVSNPRYETEMDYDSDPLQRSIQETRDQITMLEEQMDARLEALGNTVSEALEVMGEELEKRRRPRSTSKRSVGRHWW